MIIQKKIDHIENHDIKQLIEYIKCLESRVVFLENVISNTFSLNINNTCNNNLIN